MTTEITGAAPTLPATELSPEACDYAKASAAVSTRRNYAAQLTLWATFCAEGGLTPFPADPIAAGDWLAQRAAAGQAVATLRVAVAAIRAGSSALGHQFDTQHSAIVYVLRGVAHTRSREQRQVEPLRGVDVIGVLSKIGSQPIDRRDAALLAVGYAFGLRRSELVGLDHQRLGSGNGFLRVTSSALELMLVRSKTGPGSVQAVAIPRDPNAKVMQVLEAWITTADIKSGKALFPSVSKAGVISPRRLHPNAIALILKKRVAHWFRALGDRPDVAEQKAESYAGHSLRVGFATTAAEQGADLRQIADVTRHKSLEMPRRYAQKADQLKPSAHNLAGVGLGNSSKP